MNCVCGLLVVELIGVVGVVLQESVDVVVLFVCLGDDCVQLLLLCCGLVCCGFVVWCVWVVVFGWIDCRYGLVVFLQQMFYVEGVCNCIQEWGELFLVLLVVCFCWQVGQFVEDFWVFCEFFDVVYLFYGWGEWGFCCVDFWFVEVIEYYVQFWDCFGEMCDVGKLVCLYVYVEVLFVYCDFVGVGYEGV